MNINDGYAEQLFSEFIYVRTYSRYLWDEGGRRETWEETVDRYCDFMFSKSKNASQIPFKVKRKIREKILNKQVMPSMRALWSAGPAASKNNAAMYNCSFMTIDNLRAFSDAVLLLMNGTGVGFSCSREFVDKLPTIEMQKNIPPVIHTIADSKEGWAEALKLGLETWFSGRDCKFDYSCVRPLGQPLKTFGGISSGPEPLRQLLDFSRETVIEAQGRRLTPLECHDIMCECASVIVAGGSRRSALVSLSDLDDEEMRDAKASPIPPSRWLSNNSAIYHEKPNVLDFLDEWTQLAKSGTGERGIFNLYSARKNAPKRRKSKEIVGGNPCMEIMLRRRGMCNLSEVIVRPSMDFDDLRDSMTTAVWIGVLQSTFTYFPNLDPDFTKNCLDEQLLGVSITGQMDNPKLLTEEVLELMKKHAVKTSRHAAKILDINMPAAVSSVKPSGTVSSLVNSSSGLHPRWAPYYIRRVRISKHNPLHQMMVAQGMVSYGAPENNDTAYFEFPIKSPEGSVTRHDMTAIDQLNHYLKVVKNYTEHNASCSVYVRPDEWLDVATHVYNNFDHINGVSFFPHSDAAYEAMPYEEITKERYEEMVESLPVIDFSELGLYENYDCSEGHHEYACAGGNCEI
jgi:ribonucleoside-diphosphate reductase alpha chain